MDLGLKELGITILVGAFAILALDLLVYLFFDKHIKDVFQEWMEYWDKELSPGPDESVTDSKKNRHGSKDLTIKTAIFIGLAFAIGILAEDVSYNIADEIQRPLASLPLRPKEVATTFGYGGKDETRIATLFYYKNGKLTPDWLAIDLAETGAFELADPDFGIKVNNWAKDPSQCTPSMERTDKTGDCPTHFEIAESTRRLYYTAKNRAFENDNYYDEMKRIQTRLEFSRSISLIAYLYLIASALAFVVVFIFPSLGSRIEKNKQGRWKIFGKGVVVLIVMFVVYYFSVWGYAHESYDFNKRAFGYFSTMRLTEEERRGPEREKLRLEIERLTQELEKLNTDQQKPDAPPR